MIALSRYGASALTLVLALAATTNAQRTYLDRGELAAIGGSSLAVWQVGLYTKRSLITERPLWSSPLPLESSALRALAGGCSEGKSNFLDNTFGSAITPIAALAALTVINTSWPVATPGDDAAQDAFLFGGGILSTKGVTDIAKGLFRRQRPLPCLEPDLADRRPEIDLRYDNQSFFSGHTSSAFFSCVYLNKRIRSTMRARLSDSEYRDWRWVSSATLLGWATFVGWTRLHAYKHFPSDVLVGSLVGAGLAELFYSFGNDNADKMASNTTPLLIRVRIPL